MAGKMLPQGHDRHARGAGSLNVAVAAGILLHAFTRERDQNPPWRDQTLSSTMRGALLLNPAGSAPSGGRRLVRPEARSGCGSSAS